MVAGLNTDDIGVVAGLNKDDIGVVQGCSGMVEEW